VVTQLEPGATIAHLIVHADNAGALGYVDLSASTFTNKDRTTKTFLRFLNGGAAGDANLTVGNTYTLHHCAGAAAFVLATDAIAVTFNGIDEYGCLVFTNAGGDEMHIAPDHILQIVSTNAYFIHPANILNMII